jgi:hypothetical protein
MKKIVFIVIGILIISAVVLSTEFAGKNNQKIKVRCGGALDPTCSD